MDLNHLTLFVAVAESSSFTDAADKMEVRRSTVSRGIAALERSLDTQLFSRTTRHVALTTAGKALYAKVAPQLASLQDVLGTMPEREEQPSGTLRITAPNDLAAILLPGVLAGFALRYPSVSLDVRLTNRVVELVREGFDVAIRVAAGRLRDSSLVAKRVAHSEMHIYAAPEYLARAGTPRTCEDAAEHAWVVFPAAKLTAPIPKPTSPPRIVGDDIRFVQEMVKAGVGLGALPTFLTREDVATRKLVRVLPKISMRSGSIWLVHPPSKHLPRKVTAFRDYLIEQFAMHPMFGRAA